MYHDSVKKKRKKTHFLLITARCQTNPEQGKRDRAIEREGARAPTKVHVNSPARPRERPRPSFCEAV